MPRVGCRGRPGRRAVGRRAVRRRDRAGVQESLRHLGGRGLPVPRSLRRVVRGGVGRHEGRLAGRRVWLQCQTISRLHSQTNAVKVEVPGKGLTVLG